MRTGLVLPYMLGLDVISFSEHVFVVFLFIGFQQKKKKKKKKKLGRRCEILFLSFDNFSDIACVFFLITQFIVHLLNMIKYD
jgi:hypothetical protein